MKIKQIQLINASIAWPIYAPMDKRGMEYGKYGENGFSLEKYSKVILIKTSTYVWILIFPFPN